MSEELEDAIIIGRTKKETILPKELCVELTDYIIKLQQEKEEQTKTYQKILQEQQNEIDQLERNCDVFNEQMNDAVERATELQQEKEELINWLEHNLEIQIQCYKEILSKLKGE